MFENVRDQIREKVMLAFDRLWDLPITQKIKERYDELSPIAQKASLMGSLSLIVIVLFYAPISSIFEVDDIILQFEEKRDLTRDLLRVSRDAGQIPALPMAEPAAMLESKIRTELSREQLIPEQIKNISQVDANSKLLGGVAGDALEVALIKLNIRQIVNIGYVLSRIGQSAKLEDLIIRANTEMPGYFDVDYKIVTLKAPETSMDSSEEAPKGKRR